VLGLADGLEARRSDLDGALTKTAKLLDEAGA